MIRYAAPGRINLIGEHADYNQGFALPIALPERTEVAFQPDGGDVVVVGSDREPGEVAIPLDTAPGDVTGWAGYVAGVIWALAASGHQVSGGTMAVTSGVETGSGLASSAALECAALGALAAAVDLPVGRTDLARIAQRAENEYVGAPTGLMDQLASLCGEPRRALLIDFLDAGIHPVSFDPGAAGVGLLLINSHAPHHHAGGEYAARRASCERAAAALGVRSLREVQDRPDTVLGDVPDPVDARRARHILTENRRVADVVSALGASDFAAVGRIFGASHASMRDDFQITTDHIDLIADTAVAAGALGARMTGGGFGGCVIALAPLDRCAVVEDAVRQTVERAGFDPPSAALTEAGAGAGLIDPPDSHGDHAGAPKSAASGVSNG